MEQIWFQKGNGLGEGGFATVWRGRFGRQEVVLKELKHQTEEHARQMKNEVQLW